MIRPGKHQNPDRRNGQFQNAAKGTKQISKVHDLTLKVVDFWIDRYARRVQEAEFASILRRGELCFSFFWIYGIIFEFLVIIRPKCQ